MDVVSFQTKALGLAASMLLLIVFANNLIN